MHNKFRSLRAKVAAVVLAAALIAVALPVIAQGPINIPVGLDVKIKPAPAFVQGDVPIVHGGNAPSEHNPAMVGPVQLLKAGTLDLDAGTITLPLKKGEMASGETVWFIMTDTSDPGMAEQLGINYSAKLAHADVGLATRPATLNLDGSVVFDRGTVDFSPERSVTPGAESPFPPAAFAPGAVGDIFYSPLIKLGAHVYNAPVVAFGVEADQIDFCDGNPDKALVHDRVVAICPSQKTVTMQLIQGFSYGRPVLYLSTDSNVEMAAAMEAVIFAPGLNDLLLGGEDKLFFSTEPLFAVVNGHTGTDNPQRQGFVSAMLGEGPPLTVLGGIPTISNDYSPLWAIAAAMWTQEAIDLGYRSRIMDEITFLGFVERGWLVGPDNSPVGYTGIIVNCPIIYRFW